jgi:leucyl/phenylalanyl-tRNA--protein transferase
MARYYPVADQPVVILDPGVTFPPLTDALTEPNGLLAIGGDLTAARLLDAYRRGIFPWFNDDQPPLWWSPDPRMVLFPEELRISRSLGKRLAHGDYEVRYDTAFREVMRACAGAPRPGQDGTWIGPEILRGYGELHALGYAHSVETWINGALAGGLYGVAIGRMFYGESMFHRATDASKIAFVHLVRHLQAQGFGMIDCQMHTAHLARFGAREIPRAAFAERLAGLVNWETPAPGRWIAHDLAE